MKKSSDFQTREQEVLKCRLISSLGLIPAPLYSIFHDILPSCAAIYLELYLSVFLWPGGQMKATLSHVSVKGEQSLTVTDWSERRELWLCCFHLSEPLSNTALSSADKLDPLKTMTSSWWCGVINRGGQILFNLSKSNNTTVWKYKLSLAFKYENIKMYLKSSSCRMAILLINVN